MSEYKIAEMIEVDDGDFTLDDLAADLLVSENDVMLDDETITTDHPSSGFEDDLDIIVSEEDAADDQLIPSETLPGSNLQWHPDEQKAEDRQTDWANDSDHSKFTQYLKDKVHNVPKHSGTTIPGCERACAYLKALDTEISKAMRSDLNGKIDESEIDSLRKEINDGVERLENQIKKLRGSKKADLDVRLVSTGQCDSCNSTTPLWHDVSNNNVVCLHCNASGNDSEIRKEAGTPVLNVYISPFERAIVGTIVNSGVSAGNNIEETYNLLKNKYNFTPREELAIQQLVADYGYPVLKDRGRLNENSDPAAGTGVDWATNYHA